MLKRHDQACAGPSAEIGGYFELDLPCHPELYPDAIQYQSGRAAIRAVIECAGIKQVMLPAYVCDSVIQAITSAGAAAETYALDELLYPENLPCKLPEHCVILYVNYFGLCEQNVRRLMDAFPHGRLIIDNSQALFAPHRDVLATVYSPRKFVGVPDGGLLRVAPSLELMPPAEEDTASIERIHSLLLRMAYSAREGYADFQKIALSLKDTRPLRMSRLTQRLMKSISWDNVAEQRRENFRALAQKLDTINEMGWKLDGSDVPMCYPLTLRGKKLDKIRKALIERNIFVPVYWQDALPRIKPGSIEAAMTHETMFLPIDQRMDHAQAEGLGDTVLGLMEMD
jgi:hypothetical protein